MEGFGGGGFSGISCAAKKKRSNVSRRPRSDQLNFSDYHDISSLSSTPPSYNLGKTSSDENNDFDTSSRRKEMSLRQCISKASSSSMNPSETRIGCITRRAKENRSGTSSSSGQSGVVPEELVEGRKMNKWKLKVGGITRTVHAKSASNEGSYSTKSSRTSEAHRSHQRLILQECSDEDLSPPYDNRSGSQGVQRKDITTGVSNVSKGVSLRGKMAEESFSIKQKDACEPLRKSKRVHQRRLVSGTLDDDEEERSMKRKKKSIALDEIQFSVGVGGYDSRLGTDGNRSRSGKTYKDLNYEEDEEVVSDDDAEMESNKPTNEIAVITRQRALQNGKDATSNCGASLIEFPDGLPPAPARNQKQKLSEVEQQLKKAEAAQRRRMQAEKAAKESEEEAIRRILGQDSGRKKREDKIKKRQEEIQQEKEANALIIPSNSVRWVIGPSGTIVTFSDDMGLPSIFESKPCSYPPPREKCAGPSCMNPYKYRDSKSKLPLCSLQCYKAVHEKTTTISAC